MADIAPGLTSGSSLFVTGAGAPAAGTLAFSNNANNFNGFSGGGQIGYNYQFTPGLGLRDRLRGRRPVRRFRAQPQPLRLRHRARRRHQPGFAGVQPERDRDPRLLRHGARSHRLRLRSDVVYGTGGFAYGSGGGREFGLPSTTSNSFQTGWAAGGGIEYALPGDSWLNFFRASAVTFRVEGLYVNLERENRNFGVFAITPNNTPPCSHQRPGRPPPGRPSLPWCAPA